MPKKGTAVKKQINSRVKRMGANEKRIKHLKRQNKHLEHQTDRLYTRYYKIKGKK